MRARSKAVEQNSTFAVTFPTDHELQIFNDTNGNGSSSKTVTVSPTGNVKIS